MKPLAPCVHFWRQDTCHPRQGTPNRAERSQGKVNQVTHALLATDGYTGKGENRPHSHKHNTQRVEQKGERMTSTISLQGRDNTTQHNIGEGRMMHPNSATNMCDGATRNGHVDPEKNINKPPIVIISKTRNSTRESSHTHTHLHALKVGQAFTRQNEKALLPRLELCSNHSTTMNAICRTQPPPRTQHNRCIHLTTDT